MECSAITGEGVKEVFEAATRLAMSPNEKLKKMRNVRRLFGKEWLQSFLTYNTHEGFRAVLVIDMLYNLFLKKN